ALACHVGNLADARRGPGLAPGVAKSGDVARKSACATTEPHLYPQQLVSPCLASADCPSFWASVLSQYIERRLDLAMSVRIAGARGGLEAARVHRPRVVQTSQLLERLSAVIISR